MLESPDRYAGLSAKALAHAHSADFSPPELARRFLAACQAATPKVGGLARGLRAMWRGVAGL